MKKIVLLSGGVKFSHSAFEFAKLLYEVEPFLLTGAFFHSIDYGVLVPMAFTHNASTFISFTEDERKAYRETIDEFRNLCVKNNMEYSIHEESEEWKIKELVKESRFTDLIIVSGELFFADVEKEQPNFFLKEVLSKSECPVIVVPEKEQAVNRISIAYNGEKESIYALKQFCYLFPEFTKLPVDIYYWADGSDKNIPDFDYLKEYAGRHFTDLNFVELSSTPSYSINSWMKYSKNVIFVCGSYNRSAFSTWFRKSFAENLIKEHSVIVFIAHRS